MRRVRLVLRAQDDLREIHAWITSHNPQSAAVYLEGLYSTFRHLADWPKSGKNREEILPRLRSFVHREHVIFYRSTSVGISVIRVVHGKRDLGRIFQ